MVHLGGNIHLHKLAGSPADIAINLPRVGKGCIRPVTVARSYGDGHSSVAEGEA